MRIAKVVPLFLIVVLSYYAIQKLGTTDVNYDIPNEIDLLSHIEFLSGTLVLWIIPVEIQFYFIFNFSMVSMGETTMSIVYLSRDISYISNMRFFTI